MKYITNYWLNSFYLCEIYEVAKDYFLNSLQTYLIWVVLKCLLWHFSHPHPSKIQCFLYTCKKKNCFPNTYNKIIANFLRLWWEQISEMYQNVASFGLRAVLKSTPLLAYFTVYQVVLFRKRKKKSIFLLTYE